MPTSTTESPPFAYSIVSGPKGGFVFFDYVVSLAAVVVNLVVLVSVIKAKIHLRGYKYFLTSLGVSNLYLCCVNIGIFVTEAVQLHYRTDVMCLLRILRSLQMAGFIANLLNLSGMSYDHLVGIVSFFDFFKV